MKANSASLAIVLCASVFIVVGWLSSLTAFAAEVSEDPLERQTLEIAKDLRCTVCQNQSVADSSADLALDMRKIIREQVAAGKSRDEIVDYFVARYGDYVLMKPRYGGSALLVWVLPLLLLAVLAVSAFVYLRHRLGKPTPPPSALSPEDVARVRAARGEDP
jgi:cytochrome c-type biogenesis protein CcmH